MTGAVADDDATLAGEYVCGLLDEAEARAVEQRLTLDADLRQSVAEAREQFLELDLTADSLPLPQQLWLRIEQGIAAERKPISGGLDRPKPKRVLSLPIRWEGFWQGAVAASVATMLLAGALIASLPGILGQPEPKVIAILLDSAGRPGAIVEASADNLVRLIPLKDIDVPEGRALQVWTKPNPEIGAVSLGLLPEVTRVMLGRAGLPEPQASQLYEVTLEAEGGSPTGRPTGPIVLKGFAEQPL